MAYDQNEGLGAAMAQSHSDSRIAALEARVAHLELIVQQMQRNGTWPSGFPLANTFG